MSPRVTAIQNYREISHGWIFCFLSCKTRSWTQVSIVCSHFSILYLCRNWDSRIELRNWDSQWTVINWLLNRTVCVTALLKDWLTDCLIDWMNWMLTILLADRLTGLFKGRFIIYVEEAMVPITIIFLGSGQDFFLKFSPFVFINCQQHSQRKKTLKFYNTTTGFPMKRGLKNQWRNSTLMNQIWLELLIGWSKFPFCRTNQMHYPDLGSASAGHAVREISFNQSEAPARSG